MTNPLAGYHSGPEEFLDDSHATRDAWDQLDATPGLDTWDGLLARQDDVAAILAEEGLHAGATDTGDWSLDPLPIIVAEPQWQHLEAGLTQRVELLDALLTDLYHERHLLTDDVLPAELVLGHPGFLRAADQITVPSTHQLFYAGTEVARLASGGWIVTEDGTDLPAGLGHVLAARRAVSRALTEGYRKLPVRRVSPFFHTMRQALARITPAGSSTPRIVVLVPSPRSTGLDHLRLADALGLPAVDADDLLVADGRVWLRSVGDMEPVDVLVRHVSSARSDPVDLYTRSVSGVPGLVEAAHAGTVSIVNPIGSAMLENPALLSYLPSLARTLLDTDLLLPSITTYWCGERAMGSHVIAHLNQLLITHTASGRQVRGWELSAAERTDLAVQIAATPHEWVGQDPPELSTTPILGRSGLQPSTTSIRTFAVAADGKYHVLPGGIATTGTEPGRLAGRGRAKDVWVLSASPLTQVGGGIRLAGPTALSVTSASELFGFGVLAERADTKLRMLRAAGGDEAALAGRIEIGPADVTGALAELTRAAHGVRDHLTPEAWRAIALLEEPAPLTDHLMHLAALAGIMAESLVRDQGWGVLDIGRRLARAEFVVGSVRGVLGHPAGEATTAERVAVLARMHDITLMHRRRSHEHAPLPALLDLLLAEPANPRSLTFLLRRVAEDLAQLPRPRTSPGTIRGQLLASLEELAAEVDTAWLAEPDSTGRLRHLEDFTEAVDWRVSKLIAGFGRWSRQGGVLWSVGDPEQAPETRPSAWEGGTDV